MRQRGSNYILDLEREPSGVLLGTGVQRLLTPLGEKRGPLSRLESLSRGKLRAGLHCSKVPRIRMAGLKRIPAQSTAAAPAPSGEEPLIMQAGDLKIPQSQAHLKFKNF